MPIRTMRNAQNSPAYEAIKLVNLCPDSVGGQEIYRCECMKRATLCKSDGQVANESSGWPKSCPV
eukprot:6491726-Amphidinium_carterae.3